MRDQAAVFLPVRNLVGVGDQGHLLEEVGQGTVGTGPVELAGDRHQLLQVLHPAGVLQV